MRTATLVLNSNARSASALDADSVLEGLAAQGYETSYLELENKHEAAAQVRQLKGLVLIAGGDGTVRELALQLLGRRDLELLILPAGTANNIARTLGLTMPPEQIVPALEDSVVVPFDVGRLRGALGEHYFLESCGAGVLADAMAAYDPGEGKSVVRALRTMLELLPNYEGYDWQMQLDGAPADGRYILVEALNTRSMGPRLRLAPEAEPGDGQLDLLRIMDSDRHSFLEYARKMRAATLDELENVSIDRVKQLRLQWCGFPVHVDDEVLGTESSVADLPAAGAELLIDVLPGALRFRIPRAALETAGPTGEVELSR